MVNIAQQRAVQIGDEAAGWGSNSAPTKVLSGIMPDQLSLPPSIMRQVVQAARGAIGPGRDLVTVGHEVNGGSLGGWVIYEQIPYILDGLDEVSPDGAGPYTYTYNGPTSTQCTPHPQTLVMGVGDAVYGITSFCVGNLQFTWSAREGLRWTATPMGYAVVADAFASLSETAGTGLTYALASHCNLYIDAYGGTAGSTAYTGTVVSGSITIDPQRHYLKNGGALYPSGVYDSPYWNPTFSLVLEEDSTTAGLADAVHAGSGDTKLVRIDFTNGGAGAAERGLLFDFVTRLTLGDSFTDDEGMSTITLTGEPVEAADGSYFEMVSTSSTATLYA